MMRRIKTGVIIVLFLGLAYWAWNLLFPRPELIIRQRLVELAKLASFSANDGPLAKVANSQKLSNYFSDDVEILVGIPGYQQVIRGRNGVREASMMARSAVSGLSVDLPDIDVKVTPDRQSATANITARVRIGGDKDDDLRELSCRFAKFDGDWLITHVENVKTLRN